MSSIVAVIIAIVFITWMVLGIGGIRTRSIVHAIALSGASLAACVACFHAARCKPLGFGRVWTASRRRAWRLLGAAALSWTLGELFCAYSHIINSIELHFPSLIDFGYVSAAPMLVAGVLAFPVGPVATTARLRTMLDGLVVVACLLFLCWAIVLGDAYRTGNSSALGQAFSLAYPLGDVVAGTMALLLLTNSSGRGCTQLRMIAAAVLALAISDSSYIYLSQTGAYHVGVLDAGWLIGWLLLMVSALKPTVAALPRTNKEKKPSHSRLRLLYMPIVLASLTVLIIQILKGRFEPFLVFTGMAIGLLLVARQVITVIENHQLSARLKVTASQRLSPA